MKSKVVNTIPGRKAKDTALEKKPPLMPEETVEAEVKAPEAEKPGPRETPDDKFRKAEARKEFEAGVRGKLKYSRKR
jgi:hypothetical protein